MATDDDHTPRVLQVAVDCVEERGGIFRAVCDFQRALGGRTLSFTARALIPSPGNADTIHLPVAGGAIAQRYAMPHTEALPGLVQGQLQRISLIVVHGMYRYHAQWAGAIARARGIPYWVVPHGALDPWVFSYGAVRKKIWMRVVGSRILRHAHSVIVATAREAEKAAPYLAGCGVRVVHLPVPPISTDKREEARSSVRAQLGIPDDARILLFLGRLHPMKRVMETIEAVHKANHPGVHLVVVGPSSTELSVEACRGRAEQLDARNIHVVGPSFGPEKLRWLLGADGFISLSHRENFNYSAAEALSAGIPVILSPGNDLASELAPSRAGWLLESFAHDEEVEAIRQFGDLPVDQLTAMGTAGARWASAKLSYAAFAASLLQLRGQLGGEKS